MEFKTFGAAVNQQYKKMLALSTELFVVNVSRDELFELYLKSYPEGTNPIYITRTEHDCSCCKSFVRNTGHVVAIDPQGNWHSIWDVTVDEPAFQAVADALSAFVKSKEIAGVFRSDEPKLGNMQTKQENITWNHFYFDLPTRLVLKAMSQGAFAGQINTNKQLLERGVREITLEAAEAVRDVIAQNSLYRGTEYKSVVDLAVKLIREFQSVEESQQNTWLWVTATKYGDAVGFKNVVIGTLLEDLSSGTDLEKAVNAFNKKMAPENYRRTTALYSVAQLERLKESLAEYGPLVTHRRFAKADDISITNIIFADNAVKPLMADALGGLIATATARSVQNLDNVQEMTIQEFLDNVVPNATTIEVMVSNKHQNNLMSLVAPQDPEAGSILKWSDNNFTWSYNGEVTDAIKERVKNAGGQVVGDLRISLSWSNYDDLDLHVSEPGGFRIYFGDKTSRKTGGTLDVDMNAGGGKTREPVENIIYVDRARMTPGKYQVNVNQFSKRENQDVGFTVQMEYLGEVTEYHYPQAVTGVVPVLTFDYSHKDGVEVLNSIKSGPSSVASNEVWGIHTNQWTKVKMIMNSPNHWDGNATGNKHWFFILDNCVNPDPARCFYNEFLKGELNVHRKALEGLAAHLKTPYTTNQLSGIGFSSTIPNSVLVRVEGKFNRTVKVNF